MKSPLEKLFRSECIHPLAKGAYTTDKGSDHDYIEGYYAEEFGDKQDVATDILEIGVMSGGSLILWTKWFPKANVEGIDIFPETVDRYNEIKGNSEYPNVKIHIADAYDPEVADKFTDGKYDYIVDDGPHSLDSMKNAISLYMKKLKKGGKLIIEDVQNEKWFTELASHAASLGHTEYRTFDLRKNKNRSDDMIFELTNNGTQKAK